MDIKLGHGDQKNVMICLEMKTHGGTLVKTL